VIYQGVRAEVRRLGEADWQVAGVVIGGAWHPSQPGIAPADGRLTDAGVARTVELPAFLAPDDRTAWRVALEVAYLAGYADPDPRWFPESDGERIEMPDLTDEIGALLEDGTSGHPSPKRES
jgi:hypothetical protein